MSEQRKYFPQLDSVRGISFLVVFFYHAFKPIWNNSLVDRFLRFLQYNMPFSIDVFFILSAFLLTFLGIDEYKKTGKFSFKNYFIRRALRIWPLYYLLMVFSFVVLKILENYTGQNITLPPSEWYIFFISNFYLPEHVFFLRLLWTLSVEEQFYLIWGICLFLFQRKLEFIILIFVFLSVIFIVVQTIRGIGIYFHTLTYIIDMMAGAFAAYSIKRDSAIVKYFKLFSKNKGYLFYLFLPILFFVYFFIDEQLSGVIKQLVSELIRLIFIIYCSLLIIDQMVNRKPVINLSNKNFLIYTGKISYGLYCFHGFVISFGLIFFKRFNIYLPSLLIAFIFLIITFFVASLSYYYFEKPFLKLKDKLRKV
jgi:peptidoglycan/LPS O-acetylase OafA/YrhL